MATAPLHVLLFDADENLARLLGVSLRSSGWTVEALADVRRLRSAILDQRPAILIADVGTVREHGVDAVRSSLPADLPVVVASSGPASDEGTRVLADKMRAVEILRKPFSLLDLPDTLRKHARPPQRIVPVRRAAEPPRPPAQPAPPPRAAPERAPEPRRVAPPAPAPAPSRPPAPAPARSRPKAPTMDARLAPAPRADAGDPLSGLSRHLAAPREAETVSGRNAHLLARLWRERATGDLVLATGKSEYRFALRMGGIADAEDWSAVQRALTGDGSLRFLAAPGAAGTGDWEGLATALFAAAPKLLDPRAPAVRPQDALMVTLDDASWGALPLEAGVRRALTGDARTRSLGEIAARERVPLRQLTDAAVRLVGLGLARTARGAGAAPDSPSVGSDAPTARLAPVHVHVQQAPRQVRAPISNTSSIASARRRRAGGHNEQMLKRLRDELARLEDQGPYVVLGVPETAGRKLVAEAASRLRRRYRMLAGRKDLGSEGNALASAMLERVDAAVDALSNGKAARPVAKDDLLGLGRQAIANGDFKLADRVLSKENTRRLSDPAVMANLGWARLNNPDRDEATRMEQARELLVLAEQLDPDSIEAVGYLGRLFFMEGEVSRAQLRARRMLQIDPHSEEGMALLAECDARMKELEDLGGGSARRR